MACDNPRTTELDSNVDNQGFYILTVEYIERKPQFMFTPPQTYTTTRHNTFTA